MTLERIPQWLAMVRGRRQIKTFSACLLIAAALASGCSPGKSYVPNYGTSYNGERVKRRIPIIPQGWAIRDYGKFFDCYDPNPVMTRPYRLDKRITVGANGSIQSESDTFYSGKKFIWGPDRESVDQNLFMTYDYTKQNKGDPWHITAELDADHMTLSLTRDEAKKLLASWGLE